MVGIVCDNGIRFRPIPTPSFSKAFLHRGTLRDEYKSISDLYVFWRKKILAKIVKIGVQTRQAGGAPAISSQESGAF